MNELIKKWESFKPQAYKCQAGVWTYGYGSTTKLDGTKVKQGDTITEPDAERLMAIYLDKEVNQYLDKDLPDLKPNQREALQSLLYNWGYPSFRKSKLFKAIKNKDMREIFKQWDIITANGIVSRGLIRRRLDEMTVFFETEL